MIIAVGYRVNSKKATKFRIKQDKEYISSMDEIYKRYIEEINK